MGKVQIYTSDIFHRNKNSTARIIINRGGTRSTKTYSLMQLCVANTMRDPVNKAMPRYRAVVRKALPALRRSTLRDFLDIIKQMKVDRKFKVNKTDLTFEYIPNGSVIHFFGAENEQKVKGDKYFETFMDEADEMTYEVFKQFIMRGSRMYLSFNPSNPNTWIRTELEEKQRKMKKGRIEVIVSSFRDNPFLEDSIIEEIEMQCALDENFERVYGRGEYGALENQIFTDYEIFDNPVGHYDCIGLDFGYSSAPHAAVALSYRGTDLYLTELVYEKNIDIKTLARKLKFAMSTYKIHYDIPVYADSANALLVKDLQANGINALPVPKGPNSVVQGIMRLKGHRLKIFSGSPNLIREMKIYRWEKDAAGNSLEIPVKFDDHAIDAARYGDWGRSKALVKWL